MTRLWDLLAWLAAVEPARDGGAGLVNCPACGAEAVVPVDWEDGDDHWEIALRCGACGERREVTLDDDEAREFGRALDRGVHRIARTARALERRRMESETEALAIALERDLIGADDFAPGRPAS